MYFAVSMFDFPPCTRAIPRFNLVFSHVPSPPLPPPPRLLPPPQDEAAFAGYHKMAQSDARKYGQNQPWMNYRTIVQNPCITVGSLGPNELAGYGGLKQVIAGISDCRGPPSEFPTVAPESLESGRRGFLRS